MRIPALVGRHFFSSWWRHQMETFSALLAICAGNLPVSGEFPHKGQWRVALIFSLICVWINGWVNNREAGDLRRYRAHYDVSVMWSAKTPNHVFYDRLLTAMRCNVYYMWMWQCPGFLKYLFHLATVLVIPNKLQSCLHPCSCGRLQKRGWGLNSIRKR